jgi:hypothetical protein
LLEVELVEPVELDDLLVLSVALLTFMYLSAVRQPGMGTR